MVQILSEPQEDRILECVGEQIAFGRSLHQASRILTLPPSSSSSTST
jgi:hypothetical protein